MAHYFYCFPSPHFYFDFFDIFCCCFLWDVFFLNHLFFLCSYAQHFYRSQHSLCQSQHVFLCLFLATFVLAISSIHVELTMLTWLIFSDFLFLCSWYLSCNPSVVTSQSFISLHSWRNVTRSMYSSSSFTSPQYMKSRSASKRPLHIQVRELGWFSITKYNCCCKPRGWICAQNFLFSALARLTSQNSLFIIFFWVSLAKFWNCSHFRWLFVICYLGIKISMGKLPFFWLTRKLGPGWHCTMRKRGT